MVFLKEKGRKEVGDRKECHEKGLASIMKDWEGREGRLKKGILTPACCKNISQISSR